MSSCDLSGNCNASLQYSFTTPAIATATATGGGGGGGGSTSTYSRCSEWNEWSTCSSGTQTRSCKKTESVSYLDREPTSQSQSCSMPSPSNTTNTEIIEEINTENDEIPTEEPKRGINFLTGAVVGFVRTGAGKVILIILGTLGLGYTGLEIYRRRDLKRKRMLGYID